jgi:hypothetical protein
VLVCGRLPVEKRFLRCSNAHYQERRASARRGSDKRSLRREERMLFSNKRTHNQERRASARRGLRAAPATATVYRGETHFDRGPGSHEPQSRIAIDQWQSSVKKSGGRQPAVV